MPGSNSNHLILAIAFVDAQKHRHSKYAITSSDVCATFSFKLHWINGEDVDFLIFLVEAAFLEFVKWVNVEFVFLLDIFDVFFDFQEVGRESGPALRGVDGPDVNAAAFDAGCCYEGAGRVPLVYR